MQTQRAVHRPSRLRAAAHANPVRTGPPPGATAAHAFLGLCGRDRTDLLRRTAQRARAGLSGLGQAPVRLSASYFFAGSVDDEDDEVPLPVVDDEEEEPGVPVPVVPVEPVPDVEPALPLVVPAVLPVPVPLPLVLGLPVPLPLPVVALLLEVSEPALPEGDVVDDDDEVGGGGAGVTTVVEDDDEGGVPAPVPLPVVGGVSWRC